MAKIPEGASLAWLLQRARLGDSPADAWQVSVTVPRCRHDESNAEGVCAGDTLSRCHHSRWKASPTVRWRWILSEFSMKYHGVVADEDGLSESPLRLFWFCHSAMKAMKAMNHSGNYRFISKIPRCSFFMFVQQRWTLESVWLICFLSDFPQRRRPQMTLMRPFSRRSMSCWR